MKRNEEPLFVLWHALQRGEIVPFEWMVAHAPRGDLQSAWDAASDPVLLARVYGRTPDSRAGLVRMAVACARVALAHNALNTHVARDVLNITDAWVRGEASDVQVRSGRALLGSLPPGGKLSQTLSALVAVEFAAGTVTTRDPAAIASTSIDRSADALTSDDLGNAAWQRAHAVVLRQLADIVRGVAPVAPTFAALGMR